MNSKISPEKFHGSFHLAETKNEHDGNGQPGFCTVSPECILTHQLFEKAVNRGQPAG